MWNVKGYLDSFVKNKEDVNEVLRLMETSRPLYTFVDDLYTDITTSSLTDEYYKNGGAKIKDPFSSHIISLIKEDKEEEAKTQLRLLLDLFERLYA